MHCLEALYIDMEGVTTGQAGLKVTDVHILIENARKMRFLL